jgi:hypothetical protein
MGSVLSRQLLLDLFAELGRDLGDNVDLTVVGGSAGMLTEQLPPARTTIDCDVIRTEPPELFAALRDAAANLARARGLPEDWLSDQVGQLDVLPSGWRRRRIEVGAFGRLHVWCVGRLDLLAMKVYAGRMQDRGDVLDMKPTAEEIAFIRRYLDQLRVPRREANLDQIQSALRFLDALEEAEG